MSNFLSVEPSTDHVDIWQLSFDSECDLENYRCYLNDEEIKRADKLVIPEKQRQFVITRAILRSVLANILNDSPEHIAIDYTDQGKPVIQGHVQDKPVCFNVSHSGPRALIALTLGQQIGIDIEKMEPDKDYIGLSQRFFSPQEQQELQSVDDQELARWFYCCWTRKEAFVKAIGGGIRYGLANFDVTTDPDCELGQIKLHQPMQTNQSWFNLAVKTEPGYMAAIALGDTAVILRYQTINF